ncbi:MAG: DNA primase [Parcubacteria group bacterium]|nr:DNA primase [Parcubacteria group bacterium]
MTSSVEQIKERLSIVDVVSSYVKLVKAGKNYKANSPFSNEKTPSFYVSPDRDMYYCFSTTQGGDIFTFVQKMEGVDFSGALKILADRAGVALVYGGGENRDERDKLYQILDSATVYFENNIKSRKDVVKYLLDRGLSDRTIKIFRVGYAFNEWQGLHEYLVSKGYGVSDIEKVGLLKKADDGKRLYDTFRGRIMFPIKDSAGRVVAFSGRVFEGGENMGKYINSPETPLYQKSRILFGYDMAKQTIRKHDFSIVVEGQVDVLMSHQAGFTNTVAISGTALTLEQLTLLKRLSKNVVLAFDSDDAGLASAKRSSLLALSLGMDVKVACMNAGVDPADLIKVDKEKWRSTVKESKHIVDFLLDKLSEEELDARKFKKKVAAEVLPFIRQIENKIDQGHFIEKVAKRIGVFEESVKEEVLKATLNTKEVEDDTVKRIPTTNVVAKTRRGRIEQKLLGIIHWQESLKKPMMDMIKLRKSFTEAIGSERMSELEERLSDRIDEDMFRAELSYRDDSLMSDDVDELINALSMENVKEELSKVTEELRQAEYEGDNKKTEKLLEKSKKLSETIANLSMNE